MKRLIVIVTLIAICLSARLCASQSPSAYTYISIDGLPSFEVYDVFQDSKGFMWFGTDNGVCRFDGRELEVFNMNDGLSDPVVFGIQEDHRGRIWFRTYSGNISYYHDGKIYPFKYNAQLKQICKRSILFSMHVDTLDALWFAAGPYIGHLDASGKMDTVVLKKGSLRIDEIEGKQLYSYHGAIGNANSIFYNNRYYPLPTHEKGPQYHVMCATQWKGVLYFSINNHIYKIEGGSIRHVKTAKAQVVFLSGNENNQLWIGYLHHGAERFTTTFDEPELSLLEDMTVTNVLTDHEGGLWLSCLESGVHYLPNPLVKHTKNLASEKITAVADDEQKIVTGNFAGELKIYDAFSHKFAYVKSLGYPVIALTRMTGGDYWASHSAGTTVFDHAFNIKVEIFGSKMAFAELPNGNVLTTSAHWITILDKEGNVIEYRKPDNVYRTVLISDSLDLLAGRSGLDIYNENTRRLRSIPVFKNVKIRTLGNLNDSLIFIGTLGNGFSILNKVTGKISKFNSQNKFSSDNVYCMALKDSLLWIGTDKGIAMSSVRSLVEQNFSFKFLTKRTGLMSDKINSLLATDNSLWVFSDEGTSNVPYSGITFANTAPLFHLMEIQVNNQKVEAATKLILLHTENNIVLKYRSVSFNNDNILTRYKLQYTDPWIYSDARALLFSSLAPGAYSFELEYSADNQAWKPALDPILITITPPWWNRWYSYVSGFLLVLVVGYLYFKYLRSIYRQKNHYLQIINDHQHKLLQSEIVTIERERNRISKELHDRVGTNLTAIKLMVSQLLKTHKDPTAPDVEEQFQVAIREIKEIIYGLTPPSLERYGLFTGLKNYIGKLNKSIPLNIFLKTFGNEINKYEVNIILFRVLQELITNSIKHSFAKTVTIHINSFEDILNIVYEDDGIGFSYDPLQGGLGLDSIESRINSLGGNLRFDSGEFGISYTIDIPINLNKEVV